MPAAKRSFSPILIRLLVGSVFLSEGIQKFLFPVALGAGRFAEIGIPAPQVMAPFVGCVEILCGLLILAGFLTRLAVIPLLIVTTKIPMLLNQGFWKMAHETRVDWSMLLGLIFLLFSGPGTIALDSVRAGASEQSKTSDQSN